MELSIRNLPEINKYEPFSLDLQIYELSDVS